MENQSQAPLYCPKAVGNQFVERYYTILYEHPQLVDGFYLESSVLSRPAPDGTTMTVTTKQDIQNTILSFDNQNFGVKILTVDSQISFKGGVIVFVTGYHVMGTGRNNNDVRRNFAQTFFLAPQETGFFVSNDIFRYADNKAATNDKITREAPLVPNHAITEPSVVADQPDINIGKEDNQVLENQQSVTENSDVAGNSVAPQVTEAAAASKTQNDDAPKTFASLAKALSENKAPFITRTPPAPPRAPAVTPKSVPPPKTPPVTPKAEVKSYAIFVGRLPMDATVEGLEKVFNQFGPIKRNGVQVRRNQQQGTCFGFVKFESAESMQSVLQSKITLDGCELFIEERKNNVAAAVKSYAIFVGRLPMDVTVEGLEEFFGQFGPIKRDGVQIRRNQQQGSCFGFVEFESAESMQSVLQEPITCEGRQLFIEEKRAYNDKGRSRYPNGNFRGNNENYGSENHSGGRRGNYGEDRGNGRNDPEKRGEFSGQKRGNSGRYGAHQNQRPNQNGGKSARQPVKSVA